MKKENPEENNRRQTSSKWVRKFEEIVRKQENCFFDHRNFVKIYEHYATKMDFEKAGKVVKMALEQYPFSSYFFIKKAHLHLLAKDYAKAITALDRAKVLDAAEPEIYFIESRVYAELENYDQANVVLNELLEFIDSELIFEVYLEFADINHKQGAWKQELEHIKMALILQPDSQEGLDRVLEIIDERGLFQDGADFHEKLLEDSPFIPYAWVNLGICHYNLEHYEQAINSFEYALALEPDIPEAYFECGEALYELYRYEEAKDYYLDSLKLSGGDADTYFSLGMCHFHLNNHHKALYYLKKTLLIDDTYEEAHYQMGSMLVKQSDKINLAITHLQKAVVYSKYNDAYVRHYISLLAHLEQWNKAIECLDDAIKSSPKKLELWMLKVACLNDTGLTEEALNIMDEAYEINSPKVSSEFYMFYSNLLILSGFKTQGEEMHQKALLVNENAETLFSDWINNYYKPELLR